MKLTEKQKENLKKFDYYADARQLVYVEIVDRPFLQCDLAEYEAKCDNWLNSDLTEVEEEIVSIASPCEVYRLVNNKGFCLVIRQECNERIYAWDMMKKVS